MLDSYFIDEPYYDDNYERSSTESSLETIYEIFERDYSA
ncbi:hypothetical protein L21TH_2199 [Caldisalinibacter kiritimatiensis]|uniref:Uncharacterized protein n=1 Tax=Caldisalinibacter kiritimatiensis TaxID=1304284 RepID=R1CBS4_9FIRM|nr:hypothetical protein L21TH_2199 [Caldisalinibacter kiritimatiensis]